MKCINPKRAGELGMQHAGLLAQMGAIVENANRAARELRGDELLQYDRLAGQAAKVLADLRAIDPLAAKVANGNAPMRRTALLADLDAIEDEDRARDPSARQAIRPPQHGLNEMMRQIQSGVRDDRFKKKPH